MRSDQPGHAVAQLVAELGEPQGLEVVRPSLEETYLDLIGVAPMTGGRAEGQTEEQSEGQTEKQAEGQTEVAAQ